VAHLKVMKSKSSISSES